MDMNEMFSSIDVSVSGLKAQDQRLRTIANNIANARTTRTATGKPYRRKDVVFKTELDKLAGVSVSGVVEDQSPFKQVYDPGHPDAKNGYVSFPNVDVPVEMVNLMSASRAYQANLFLMRRFMEMVDVSLELLR